MTLPDFRARNNEASAKSYRTAMARYMARHLQDNPQYQAVPGKPWCAYRVCGARVEVLRAVVKPTPEIRTHHEPIVGGMVHIWGDRFAVTPSGLVLPTAPKQATPLVTPGARAAMEQATMERHRKGRGQVLAGEPVWYKVLAGDRVRFYAYEGADELTETRQLNASGIVLYKGNSYEMIGDHLQKL